MFILRKITKERGHFNLCLGENYITVRQEDEDFEFFRNENCHPDSVTGFIIYDNKGEQEIWPLYPNFHYYIMTDSGKTFEHLSWAREIIRTESAQIKTDGEHEILDFHEYSKDEEREHEDAKYCGKVIIENCKWLVEWMENGEVVEDDFPVSLSDLNIIKMFKKK